MKQAGWMVNITMRRVEYVTAAESRLNRPDYGLYRGPRRTYMLYDSQVSDSELEAMRRLFDRMTDRRTALVAQLRKYTTELDSVKAGLESLQEQE